jgi:cytoskeletal protein CcmA (bactofilin family)
MVMFEKHKGSKPGSPQIKESIAMQESPPTAARASAPAAKTAVIGAGIEIAGDVTASADLSINGRIKGSIVQSSHDVDIAESGKVRANISARVVKVAGEVAGDLAGSEKVLISKTGRVQGNIVSPRVQLEDGAIFRGSIDMDPGKVVKQAAPAPAKKTTDSSRTVSSAGSSAAGPDTKASGNGTGPVLAKDTGRKEPGLTLKSG